MEDDQRRSRRQFPAEFTRDAVELVPTTGRPIAQTARELGIDHSTPGHWVRQDGIDRGQQDGLSSDEQARRRAPERENAQLRMDHELLKRTVAFWAKDVDTVMGDRGVDAQKAAGFPVVAACQAAGCPLGLRRLDHRRPPSS